MKNPLKDLTQFDQSIWLDFIRRDMLTSGEMEQLITEDKVKGVTSNPAIFKKAFDSGDLYESAIRAKALQGMSASEIYQSLAIEDIQFATDLFYPVYEGTDGKDGFVSLEVSPHLAHDTDGTIEEARDLWQKVNRPNVLIKVPGTEEGLPAIEQLISEGINVNVTLLFGLDRYRAVTEAYLSGLEQRVKADKSIDSIASVASFFLSRIDVLVDPMLEEYMEKGGEKAKLAERMHGQVAISSARKAYQIYKEVFNSDRFKKLREAGAKTQRVLWASTSTKNPDYSDVKYVDALIGPETVNTIPMETLEAYRDHGDPESRVEDDLDRANQVMEDLPKLDIDIGEVTQQLEDEGVDKFCNPFDSLMKVLKKQRKEALSLSVNDMHADLGSFDSDIEQRLQKMNEQDFNSRIWQKDPSLWTDDKESQEMIPDAMGWLDVAGEMISAVPRLEHFAEKIREAGFTHVVHMGMGGSSLAPLLFERTFEPAGNDLELTVLDTTDPATIHKIKEDIPLEKTLFIVASKSGTTAEPNAFGDYFYKKLKTLKGTNAGQHFAVITDPGTPLVDKANERNYRRIFLNFKDIGGRYSALSYFGMVPAALMGVDIGSLLERALRMQHACHKNGSASVNPALQLGAIIGEMATKGRDKLTLVLPDSLSTLGMWLEQLLAESTGKKDKGILPVTGEALLDPSEYGEDRLFVHLYLKGEKDAETQKKIDALKEAGHPVVTIEVTEKMDIGQEFYRWEMAVAAAGAIIGINAFNQPNVQLSKDKTNELIGQVKEKGSLPEKEASLQEGDISFYGDSASESANQTVRKFFEQVNPGDYFAIQAYLTEESETEKLLQRLRKTVQKKYDIATTIGYGPRFLHSTGQYHKGGPNTGLFLQLTADDQIELDVPDTNYTFGILKHAQAAGDLEALNNRNRRVLRIDLGSDVHAGLKKLNEWFSQKVAVHH
ncbi:MAG TPA: bifunctional transaldolase/phosoglucose isomerase [Balneolaceae bacterium]|nr:bifunctional transaldolase/phosoglucose isomerase [Balneolaceae bacterium]